MSNAANQDEMVRVLRARGERLTPQRLLVLEALQEGCGHQSAEQLHERVRATYPYVNIATIYRSLAWLKEQRLITETDLGTGQIEYEYIAGGRHHHLVCLKCGHQQEFADVMLEPLAAGLRERYGFAPRLDHLAVFGLCRHCQPGGAIPAPVPS